MKNWREIQVYCLIQCAAVRLIGKKEVAKNVVTIPDVLKKRLPRLNIKIKLGWLEIVFDIFSTRKRFTFIYIIAAFNVAT